MSALNQATMTWLKRRHEAFLDSHPDAADWQSRMFSGITYSLWAASRQLVREHCRGLVLDAGSGRGAWRSSILETAASYESIDIAPRHDHVPTWIGDVCFMSQVPDGRYKAAVCHQVLEHVRSPSLAVGQLFRVLKPGGTLIVSVPHLSRRHELPHDYFRFTQEGLAAMLIDSGFSVDKVVAYGGILSFLHHQASMIVLGLIAGVPLVGTILLACNALISWCVVRLDELVDRSHLLPAGVLGIAHKPVP